MRKDRGTNYGHVLCKLARSWAASLAAIPAAACPVARIRPQQSGYDSYRNAIFAIPRLAKMGPSLPTPYVEQEAIESILDAYDARRSLFEAAPWLAPWGHREPAPRGSLMDERSGSDKRQVAAN
jgi:hypothetical protein